MKRSTPFLSEDFMGAFVQILLIFAAVIINVLCMTYAWLSTFNRKFKIYAICGATKRHNPYCVNSNGNSYVQWSFSGKYIVCHFKDDNKEI